MLYQEIITNVANKHHVSFEKIMSKKKYRSVAYARHEAVYELYQSGYKKPEIKQIFDLDHTSIIYAIKAHKHRQVNSKPLPPKTSKQIEHEEIKSMFYCSGINMGSMKNVVSQGLTIPMLNSLIKNAENLNYKNFSEYVSSELVKAYARLQKNNKPDRLIDRIKAHRSAPDVYDPPTFEDMANRIEEQEAALAKAVRL